jgi:autotransporter-associated beta strand protein
VYTSNTDLTLNGKLTCGIASGYTLILNGIISGLYGITKIGAGMLYLNGTNIYNGTTLINGGNLIIANTVNTTYKDITIDPTGVLTIANTALLTISGAFVNNKSVTINNGSALTVSGTFSGAGSITNNGTLKIANTTATTLSGAFTNSGTFENASTALLTLSGAVSNTGTLTFTTTATLSGLLTSTGPISVALSKILTLNNATLYGTISGDGTISIVSAKIVTISNATLSPIISGAGGITVNDTVTLSGKNTYTGPTLINGILIFDNKDAITLTGSISGAGEIRSNNTLTLSPSVSPTLVFSGNIYINSGSLYLGSGSNYVPLITGTITVGNASLYFNSTQSTTFTGYIYSTFPNGSSSTLSSAIVKVLTSTFSNNLFNNDNSFSGTLYVEPAKTLTIGTTLYNSGMYNVISGNVSPLITLIASDISDSSITIQNVSTGTIKYGTTTDMTSSQPVTTPCTISNLINTTTYYFQLFNDVYKMSNQLSVSTPAPTPSPSASSSGDPYITTFSNIKYKLPNILRTYRLLEYPVANDTLYINATVSELSPQEKRDIKDTFQLNTVVNGFFYESFYIGTNTINAVIDRQLNIIKSNNLSNYSVTIQDEYLPYECPIQGKTTYQAKIIQIHDVTIELRKYSNPQILNGIEVSVSNPKKAKGILASNINPKNFAIKKIDNTTNMKVTDDKPYNREVKELWITTK